MAEEPDASVLTARRTA